MRYPDFLKENGTIGFVAPSFGCKLQPYRAAFENACKKWKELGYQLDLGPNCFAGEGIGISNTPEKCAGELLEYYAKKENDCLISCGGVRSWNMWISRPLDRQSPSGIWAILTIQI